jgi:hypothetical protein
MNKRSIKYRDTWAAPGSQLFEALESGDAARADRIYKECEIALRLSQGERPADVFECLPNDGLRLIVRKPHPVVLPNIC